MTVSTPHIKNLRPAPAESEGEVTNQAIDLNDVLCDFQAAHVSNEDVRELLISKGLDPNEAARVVSTLKPVDSLDPENQESGLTRSAFLAELRSIADDLKVGSENQLALTKRALAELDSAIVQQPGLEREFYATALAIAKTDYDHLWTREQFGEGRKSKELSFDIEGIVQGFRGVVQRANENSDIASLAEITQQYVELLNTHQDSGWHGIPFYAGERTTKNQDRALEELDIWVSSIRVERS